MSKFIYTNTGGTIPAVWGDSVARIDDQSPNGRNAVQANSALRPKLGRAPTSRRNLLTHTEEFDNADWGKTSASVVKDAIGLDGETTAWTQTATSTPSRSEQSVTVATSTAHTYSVYAKAGTTNFLYISPVSFTTPGNGTGVWFDLGNGAVGTQQDASQVVGSIVDAGNGFYRCSITLLTTDSVDTTGVIRNIIASANGQTGCNVGDSVVLYHPQFEAGTTPTPYQRVTTQLDVTEAGVPSPAYLRFDLSDDVIPTVFPDGFTGDVLVCGRNGSWIERDVTIAAGGTFNLGPTTITGGPAGLLAAVGDIVGYLPVGKTISATELSRLMSYFNARGAGSLLDAGDL